MSKSIYSFEVNTIQGAPKSLEDYRGKVMLIVNVASECGFTPQYKGLEELYQKYKDRGLLVLGFPCNQFGGQEPGTESEIQTFCERNFGVTFPLFAKIDVNGETAAPVYEFLKKEAPGVMGTQAIKWNFTKFLVSKDGKVLKRFASTTAPKDIESEIEKLL